MRRVVAFVAFLLFACIVAMPTARPADEEQIKQAIARGVEYLKGLQNKANGSWPYNGLADVGSADVGMTSLAGLALLECGVPADDPAIQQAAAFVRQGSVSESGTYSLALAIMFLDRLGEDVDVALIEAMGARLLAGQQPDGGWRYRSGAEILAGQQERLRQAVLRRAEGRGPGERRAPSVDERRSPSDLGREAKGDIDSILKRGPAPAVGTPGGGRDVILRSDNSNTQFAILGLWTARRYGVPVEEALKRVETRFRTTQEADGGWGYMPVAQAAGGGGRGPMFNPNPSTSAMTCAGMLGLAVYHAAANENALRAGPKGEEEKPKRGKGAKPPHDISEDAAVARGLKYLAAALAASPIEKKDEPFPGGRPGRPGAGKLPDGVQPPTSRPPQGPMPPQEGGKPPEGFQPPGGFRPPQGGRKAPEGFQRPEPPGGFRPGQDGQPGRGAFFPGKMNPRAAMEHGRGYYFLWSLERVGVAYSLPTIGGKDWYDWGADILLANQSNNGSWQGTYGQSGADTCFALLFLRRANLAKDLSASLKNKIKDTAELRADPGRLKGRDSSIKPIRSPFEDPAGSSKETGTARPTERPRSTEKPRSTQKPRPAESAANVDPDVAKLSAELVDAPPSRWTKTLDKLRGGEGPEYTQALAHAITQLDGDTRKKAREALAERLSRMKAPTLLAYLQDDDPELRRAAALAAAMKEDSTFVGKLIDLLNDPEKSVERAAHAALKDLAKQDFGPAADASEAEKADAIKKWKAWWKKQTEK